MAIKSFDLSQSLKERWAKADYNAKGTILSLMLKTVRLNCGNLKFCPREPFNLLRDEKLIPLSEASGTPVELFVAATRDFSSKTLGAMNDLSVCD